MQSITKQQIIAINTIISKRGLSEDKKSIVSGACNGRSVSTKDLTFEEAQRLLEFLNNDSIKVNDAVDRMVKKIIAMAYDLQWIKTKSVVAGKGIKTVKDYSAVYDWVKKYGSLKKDLKEYTAEELPALVTQFEQGPYAYYLKK